AVLAVGIYAIKPTQNTIEGTITIGATNPHVIITAYKTSALNEDGTEATANKLVGPLDARAGAKLQIAEALEFDVDEANTLADVDDVVIVLKIENKSSQELGAYFYEGLSTDVMPEAATQDDVRTSYLFKENESDDEDAVIKTSFTGYSYIAPYVSEEDTSNVTYMKITFTLNQFKEYTASYNFPLNIETYNSELLSGVLLNYSEEQIQLDGINVSNDSLNPTTIAGDLGYELEGSGGIYYGITNLVYTNSAEVSLLSSTDDSFSFNVEIDSPTVCTMLGVESITAQSAISDGENGWVILIPGNHSISSLLGNGELSPMENFSVDGSTITIEKSAVSDTNGCFCLFYMSVEDLTLSFSTQNFNNDQNLQITGLYETKDAFESVINGSNKVALQYTLQPLSEEAIYEFEYASISELYIKNTQDDVKSLKLTATVSNGRLYLVQTDYYNTKISSNASLSSIISEIETGVEGYYVSSSTINEAATEVTIEIPYFYLIDGNLKLTAILLSNQADQTINYSLDYSNQIANRLTYTLVDDAVNGKYYS
ncbi:MAG: hypothetical protein IJW25_03425, partial [Clostridia bacterium]|nr:hypothetical protein [Clostridia bacterium]